MRYAHSTHCVHTFSAFNVHRAHKHTRTHTAVTLLHLLYLFPGQFPFLSFSPQIVYADNTDNTDNAHGTHIARTHSAVTDTNCINNTLFTAAFSCCSYEINANCVWFEICAYKNGGTGKRHQIGSFDLILFGNSCTHSRHTKVIWCACENDTTRSWIDAFSRQCTYALYILVTWTTTNTSNNNDGDNNDNENIKKD